MNRITNNKVQNCKPQCKIGKLELLSFDQSYEHDPEPASQLVGSCCKSTNHQQNNFGTDINQMAVSITT